MMLGEVDIGLGSSLLSPIILCDLGISSVFILIVITEVDIGLTPSNFMHITMVH